MDIVLPAVVDAAEPVLFVSAPKEAGATVGAIGVEKADPARRISECNKVLAEDPQADRRAVGFR
jgi:hypothetical protein